VLLTVAVLVSLAGCGGGEDDDDDGQGTVADTAAVCMQKRILPGQPPQTASCEVSK
jgi:hypothetical protein